MANSSNIQKRCAYCHCVPTKEVKLQWCGACRSVAYCNREHQKADWKTHKPLCCPKKKQTFKIDAMATVTRSVFPQPVQPENKTLECISKFICSRLIEKDYCVIDNLYSEKEITEIISEVYCLRRSGVFKDAKLSGGITATDSSQKYTDKKTRDDELTWIEGNEPNVQHISNHMNHLDSIVNQSRKWLEELGYEVTTRSKAMVACYPKEAVGYRRHVDNPDSDGRCITALLYLNKDWKESDGGKLRIYKDTGNIDIEPLSNRLLVFWSDSRVPHEVLPSHADRYAITMWYFDSVEREKAKKLQRTGGVRHLQEQKLHSVQALCHAFDEVEKKKMERDRIKEQLERATEKINIENLSEENVSFLRALFSTYSSPDETYEVLGIDPSVQKLFWQMLKQREKWGEEKNGSLK